MRSKIPGWFFFFFVVVFFLEQVSWSCEHSVGMDLRALCLLPDEYLMALNGDLRLRSVALSWPTAHIRGLRRSCAAGDHFGLSPSGGFGCFVSPCHTTAAFDVIIAVAGLAVKQTTGRKAEAPRSRPPPLPLAAVALAKRPVHELVTTKVSRSPSVHDREMASCYTPPPHTSGRMCQYLCPPG